jgi:hypothetical protein
MNSPLDLNPASLTSALNRRSFLRRAGALAAMAPLAGMLGGRAFGQSNADPDTGSVITPVNDARDVTNESDIEILNFALNLEYLEANYYLYGVTGGGLAQYGVSTTGIGTAGGVTVKSNPKVTFTDNTMLQFATEIAHDEANHVKFLRSQLGANAIAMPQIDLLNSFNTLAQAAGLGSTFDPYANEVNFFIGGFIFEDVGVTAYRGAAPLIADKTVLSYAAGILGVEGYHASLLRTVLYLTSQETPSLDITQTVQKISDLRNTLSGSVGDDAGITFDGTDNPFIVPTDVNALVFARTPRQVLNVAYGAINATKGLFFPNGVNETPLTFP